jgi:hypothetical protein
MKWFFLVVEHSEPVAQSPEVSQDLQFGTAGLLLGEGRSFRLLGKRVS